MRTIRTPLLGFFCALLVLNSAARAQTITVQGKSIIVLVDPASGDYSVTRAELGWPFKGSVGQPLVNAQKQQGNDNLGGFSAISFDWQADGPKSGEIRAYTDRPLVQFILTCKSAQPQPPAAFPALQPP